MIRAPRSFREDAPVIEEMIRRAYGRSGYPDMGIELDDKLLPEYAASVIARANQPGLNQAFVRIAEAEGQPIGLIVGDLSRIYGISRQWSATESFFFVEPDAGFGPWLELARAFIAWAEAIPKVKLLGFTSTDAFDRGEDVTVLFKRLGLQRSGEVWLKRLGSGNE
jgi:hypothetical protein